MQARFARPWLVSGLGGARHQLRGRFGRQVVGLSVGVIAHACPVDRCRLQT